MTTPYDFSARTVEGAEQSLSAYQGKVLLIVESRQSPYAVVLFVHPPPNLVLDVFTTAVPAKYTVVVLEALNATLTCYPTTPIFFLGTSSPAQVQNCPTILNITGLTNGYIPQVMPCPPVTTIQLGGCPNGAILPILICALVLIIFIAFIPSICHHCDKVSRSAHRGALQSRKPTEDDADP